MLAGLPEKLVNRSAGWFASRTDRRGFLTKSALVGSAVAVAPGRYLLRPGSAEEVLCICSGYDCDCEALCCDGYTEFCCTIYGGNECPPGTLTAGWWKADGSGFCGGGPRYYLDCNAGCGSCGCGESGLCSGSCSGTGCGCANGSCGNRKAGCTLFRYGQCHQTVECVGPIVCRVVTCTPPWQFDANCASTPVLTDNNTRFHDRSCLHQPACDPVWSDWFDLGGGLASGTAATSLRESRVDVFAVAGVAGSELYQRFWEGSWSNWTNLGRPSGIDLSDTPGAAAWQNGTRLDVFARGSDGAVWQRYWQSPGGWGSWHSLGGLIAGGVTAVSPSSNRIDVFVVAGTAGDRLYQRYWNGQAWSSWIDLGRPASVGLTMTPGAVVWDGGRIDVFARGSDGAVWQRYWRPTGGWSGWYSLGGVVATGPSAVSPRPGRLDVFAIAGTAADSLWQRSWESSQNAWTTWTSLGRPADVAVDGHPGAAVWGGGRVDVFPRGSDGTTRQRYNPCL